MTNPTRQSTKLTVDGINYSLIFDFEAVAEVEELTGKALLTGLKSEYVNHPPIHFVRAMLYACLKADQPDMTYDEAKALVRRDTIHSIWPQVIVAWAASLPKAEDTDAADPTKGQS